MEEYWYWLCNLNGFYRRDIAKVIAYFKSPKAVYEASEKVIEGLDFLDKVHRDVIVQSRKKWNLEECYHNREVKGIKFISIDHPEYPKRLINISDPPFGLFYRGKLPDNEKKAVSIVGARRCSGYGRRFAEELARELAHCNVQVISGMASGIDGFSQRAALEEQGESFGVLGCGADICYPSQNLELYKQLCIKGGVLSEFKPGTQPLPFHFPMRNRIISGLSDAVLIIEAKQKSGSLITADLALEQGRDIFALPGRIEEKLSEGCNRLIYQGAGIILGVPEVLNDLHILSQSCIKNKKNNIILETREELLYSCLDFNSKNLHTILLETGMQAKEAANILLALEIKGYIKETAKNYYSKI